VPKNSINTVDKTLELRGGGDINKFEVALCKLIFIWSITRSHMSTQGFQTNRVNSNFNYQSSVQPRVRIASKLQNNPLNKNNLKSGCSKAKNNDGILTKEQRRNLASPDYVIISQQNVIIRDAQARYKIKNHGHDFGIKSTQNSRGRFKMKRTPENVQVFKKEIKKLVLNLQRIEGTYRKGEADSYSAIHFYDPKTRKYAIFKTQSTEFVSAWILTQEQVDDLLTNGNVED